MFIVVILYEFSNFAFCSVQYHLAELMHVALLCFFRITNSNMMPTSRGVRHAFKSRTLWLESVFKTQNQFSKHKSVLKTRNQFSKHEISSQNTKSVLKTRNQFSKHKISSQNTKSVQNQVLKS